MVRPYFYKILSLWIVFFSLTSVVHADDQVLEASSVTLEALPESDVAESLELLLLVDCPQEVGISQPCPTFAQMEDPEFPWNREKCKRRRCLAEWNFPNAKFTTPVSFCMGKCAYDGDACRGDIHVWSEGNPEPPGGRCTCMKPPRDKNGNVIPPEIIFHD